MTPSKPTIEDGSVPVDDATGSAGTLRSDTRETETVQLLEEALDVSKRDVAGGTVRVSTRTELRDEVAEVSLDRNVVDVTRVPVGRIVDAAPAVRTEDGVTIVPVLEERYVVVKQLYLTEELHIRHRVETAIERAPVQLRRQTAVVQRVDAEGRVTDEPT